MATLASNVTRSIAQTAQYVQEVWTREIEQPFDAALQAKNLVTDRSGLVTAGGDTINIPFTAGLNARAKVASTNVTYDSPEGTPIIVPIDKHYYVAVLIEDIAKIQSNYNLKAPFQARMAEALARQLDTDILSKYANAGTSIAGGATIDDADILAVVAAFDNSRTPQSGRNGVVGVYSKNDLLGVNKYNAYDQTGQAGLATKPYTSGGNDGDGKIGEIYGMNIFMSQNVPFATTGRNLFWHKSAISIAQQQAPKFEMEYSVDAIGWKTVLHTVYGVGVERPASIVELTRNTAA